MIEHRSDNPIDVGSGMNTRNDGGRAFPAGEMAGVEPGFGMSLRDYFAAKAMHAELMTNGVPGPSCDALVAAARKADRDPVYHMAVCAYEMADAMLAARDDEEV